MWLHSVAADIPLGLGRIRMTIQSQGLAEQRTDPSPHYRQSSPADMRQDVCQTEQIYLHRAYLAMDDGESTRDSPETDTGLVEQWSAVMMSLSGGSPIQLACLERQSRPVIDFCHQPLLRFKTQSEPSEANVTLWCEGPETGRTRLVYSRGAVERV